jgi:prepilin-type N-terminal cleavage/methylation domain-containing protein
MPASSRLHGERGFTLIEVLVTMLILMLGIGAAISMIDGANARTAANKDREAANSLSREVIESARSVPYRQLTQATAISELQAVPELADTTPSTTAWTVRRRNQTYTITLEVCSVDDNQDGLGDTSAGGFCTGSKLSDDANPDDYKRLTVDVSWKRSGITRNITQVGLVNNEAATTGPSVEFTGQTPDVTELTIARPNIGFDVQAEDGAAVIRFAVDGVLLDSATSTTAKFTWTIDGASEHVPDGTYLVSVTAYDVEGTPGPTRSRTIRLNRDVPAPPSDVFGGWNPRAKLSGDKDIVEMQWSRNNEPDVTGYRVYRMTGAGWELVPGCDNPLEPKITECRDLNPPAGAAIDYYIVALDKDPVDGSPRAGKESFLTATRATTQPNQPATLTAQQDDANVLLTWLPAPAAAPSYTGSNVVFYRVYRDGLTISHRIGRSGQESLTSFKDLDAAANNHKYWVTTVDENFSESDPLGPVSLP